MVEAEPDSAVVEALLTEARRFLPDMAEHLAAGAPSARVRTGARPVAARGRPFVGNVRTLLRSRCHFCSLWPL
jgi:hypothetical protein